MGGVRMTIEFLGYWEDKTPVSEYMKSPQEFAVILKKVHAEQLQLEMPEDAAKRFIKANAEVRGYVVVEDDVQRAG